MIVSTVVKKWARRTKGFDKQIFVGKAINYTTQTTYANFIANAALGEIGIYDASNNLVTTALNVTTGQFFICQQLTNGIKRTQLFTMSEITARKVLYTAPTLMTGFLGWNGVSGNFNNPDAAAAGNNYEFAIIETTEGNEPYPVFNYNYTMKPQDVSDAISPNLSVAVALTGLVNGITGLTNTTNNPIYKTNAPIVSAEAWAKFTAVNFTLGGTIPTMTFTNGSNTVTLGGTAPVFNGVVGDYIAYAADGATAPTSANAVQYKIIAVSAGVSVTLDRPFSGTTLVLSQAQAQGTIITKATAVTNVGIKFIGLNAGEVWRFAQRDELLYADQTLGTFISGSGTGAQVFALEDEGTTFQGDSAKNTAFASAFGTQDRFGSVNETYDYVFLDIARLAKVAGNWGDSPWLGGMLVCSAKSAGNLLTNLQTIFGV